MLSSMYHIISIFISKYFLNNCITFCKCYERNICFKQDIDVESINHVKCNDRNVGSGRGRSIGIRLKRNRRLNTIFFRNSINSSFKRSRKGWYRSLEKARSM